MTALATPVCAITFHLRCFRMAFTRGLVAAAAMFAGVSSASRIYSPTLFPVDFGADASGNGDSTAAFQKVMAAFLSRNTSSHILSGKAVDLGGVTLDLQGGDYLISEPLTVPLYFGNYRIIDGTLRASQSFPPDKYLLELGSDGTVCTEASDPQYAACGADASVSNVLLDGSGVAMGGMRASYIMGVNAGPDVYIVNFTTAGIMVTGGHEVMIHQTWIGSKRWQVSDMRRQHRLAMLGASTSSKVQHAEAALPARKPSVPTQGAVRQIIDPAQMASTARWAAQQASIARQNGKDWVAEDGETLAEGSPAYWVNFVNGSAGAVITSNDHYMNDVVVFSGTTYGVIVSGAANLIKGVHTWNRGTLNVACLLCCWWGASLGLPFGHLPSHLKCKANLVVDLCAVTHLQATRTVDTASSIWEAALEARTGTWAAMQVGAWNVVAADVQRGCRWM